MTLPWDSVYWLAMITCIFAAGEGMLLNAKGKNFESACAFLISFAGLAICIGASAHIGG